MNITRFTMGTGHTWIGTNATALSPVMVPTTRAWGELFWQSDEYFLETRETLQLFCLTCWIEQFENHVNDFIQEWLAESAKIMTVPENEEEDTICLSWLMMLDSWRCSRGGAGMAARPCFYLCKARQSNHMGWLRVSD
jgi:hypothetical protein